MNRVKKWGESGQALIEYIALLCISVLIILGIVYQFNDAFRQYMQAWFGPNEGGYLFCLIQNGYLPGESDVCPLPQFNLQNGKKLSANGIGGVGGSGGAGGNGNGGGAGLGLSGSRANEGGGGGAIPYNPSGGIGSSANGGANGAAGKKGASTGNTGDNGFSSGGQAGGVGSGENPLALGGRSRSVPIKDGFGSGKVKSEPIPATERDLKSPRLIAAEKRKARETDLQDVNADFSFGKILKYIIILVICFSIFFFVGSQLLAISRGNKKRN